MPRHRQLPTILIVDDDERLRKALARSLSREDCRTLTAASGEEAMALLEAGNIDLVITDLVMPGMDGLALVRHIQGTAPSMQVIIITAYGSAESMQEAGALGVACYLEKPFDLSQLKSKVNELLPAGETAASSRGKPGEAGGHRALRCLGAATGRTVMAIAGASRTALHYVRPRYVVVGAGRAVQAVSGVWVGIQRICFGVQENGVNALHENGVNGQ